MENNLDLEGLEQILNYTFKNKQLVIEAITHKSYANEHENLKHYERLEYLGDAVIDLVTSNYLFTRYPQYNEGILTRMQAVIVSAKSFSEVASKLGLVKYAIVGRGEELGRGNKSIGADLIESLSGAVYMDCQDFKTSEKVVLKLLKPLLDKYTSLESLMDYKTELQEYSQVNFSVLPLYTLVNETGPDHDKMFEVIVKIKDKLLGVGVAKTKKEAEKMAAKDALEKIKKG